MSDQNINDNNENEDYIKSLELSLSILQKENESLREINEKKLSIDKQGEISYLDYKIISEAESSSDLKSSFNSIINNKFSFLEYSLFEFTNEKGLKPLFFNQEYQQFYNYCKNFIENGVIDWVIENDQIKLIPDLDTKIESDPLKVLLIPHKSNISEFVFIAKQSDEISNSPLVKLREILAFISMKFQELTRKSSLSSVINYDNENTIIHSISEKLNLDIEKMEVNLNLLKTGIGNSAKRVEILNGDIENLKHLNIIIEDYLNQKHDLLSLIDNIIFFTKPKLNKLAIKISREEIENIDIAYNFDLLLHVLIKMIFILSKNLPEGSHFNIISNIEQNLLFLKIRDNGYGFPLKSIELINQDQKIETEDNFNDLNQLIEIKQLLIKNNISFEIISKERAGTTVNLKIPI